MFKSKILITFSLSLIAICLISSITSQTQTQTRSTTYDPDFINKYKPTFLISGDNQTYSTNGDNVTVHYNGTFPTTGQSFDSSYSRNQPFSFFLEFSSVIKCWHNVLARMSLGQRIYVVCPFNEAYGTAGSANIPASTDIAFDILFLCNNNNCLPKTTAIVIQPPVVGISGSFVKGSYGLLAAFIAFIALLF